VADSSLTNITTGNRFGRALASPIGVLITLPLLVVAVGLGVLWFSRQANRESTEVLVQQQIRLAADHVGQQVVFALDQAQPLLDRLESLANPNADIADVGPKMFDLTVGHAGVSHLSLSFPVGLLRSTYFEGSSLRVQESRVVDASHSVRQNFVVEGESVRVIEEIKNNYDPRTRPFYLHALRVPGRSWTPPRTYFSTKTTGISAVTSLRDATGNVQAVMTVDFDINAMSNFVAELAVPGARSVVFSSDGAILVYSSRDRKAPQLKQERLLLASDLDDPAITSLFANSALPVTHPTSLMLTTTDGRYLATITPIGGSRAGIAEPLNWFVATVVPESTILATTKQLERRMVIVGVVAVACAFAVALILAWNLIRLRRSVADARSAANQAQQQARELGSYRLVARIGEGGMGEVWRAEHRLLARQAAVKLMRSDMSSHGAQEIGSALQRSLARSMIAERFRREAQALASMKSRHTIALFDYGVTDDGTFFYVMELLDGLDLETLVHQFGPQPAGRVILFVLQALSSLSEAHEAGLLHRDIKPANLFACRAADEVDIVKVLDFGIVQAANESKQPVAMQQLPSGHLVPATASNVAHQGLAPSNRLTEMGAVLGTPGFMSPEQATGKPLDGRSDLYALGCVAWWLLTGREVFPAPNDAAVYYNHLYEPVPNLMAQVPQWIPPELAELITACLQKDADHRPSSARALADALRAIALPEQQWWTADKANQWWQTYRPLQHQSVAPDLNVSQQRLLVPRRSDAQPSLRDAPTISDRGRRS
jgi:serine/threonine protein kinase